MFEMVELPKGLDLCIPVLETGMSLGLSKKLYLPSISAIRRRGWVHKALLIGTPLSNLSLRVTLVEQMGMRHTGADGGPIRFLPDSRQGPGLALSRQTVRV